MDICSTRGRYYLKEAYSQQRDRLCVPHCKLVITLESVKLWGHLTVRRFNSLISRVVFSRTYSKYSVRSVARIDCFSSCMRSLYSVDERLEKILWPCGDTHRDNMIKNQCTYVTLLTAHKEPEKKEWQSLNELFNIFNIYSTEVLLYLNTGWFYRLILKNNSTRTWLTLDCWQYWPVLSHMLYKNTWWDVGICLTHFN